MSKLDSLIDILHKIYFILEHHYLRDEKSRLIEDELMSREEAKDYLGISESTYKRKVKQGHLKPLNLPGGKRFFKSQLAEEYFESIRRGRI
ncbi:MAG: helix-turn-helix domain-containing protein [Pedobacter sp.]|nr:MAG: helix-turn-helix domain-containing protein [Pedobacter sp.]